MKKTLTLEEATFANAVVSGKNRRETVLAMEPGLSPKEVSRKVSNLMSREGVKEYIESIAYGAAQRIEELSKTSDNEMVRLNANKDILDRAGFKPQEAAININIPLYLPAEVMTKYNLTPKKEEE